MLKKIAATFIGWKLVILVCVGLAIFFLPLNTQYFGGHLTHEYPYIIKVWANFDGFQYMRVARRGYQIDNLPFFPLYPLSILAIHKLTGISYFLVEALIISHISFFGALYVTAKLLQLDKLGKYLPLFLAVLLFYPTSFFYGAAYNDSLFLLFAVLCIFFSRKKRWGWASVCGALATLTRLNGLALAVYMAFEYILSEEDLKGSWSFKKFWPLLRAKLAIAQIWQSGIWLISLIPLAYISFLTYIQITFGDWRLIHKAMATWGQDKVTFPLQVFWRYVKILVLTSPHETTYWVAMIELCFVLFYLFVLWVSWKKIRLSYWIFIAVSFLIPTLTGTFAGMPRYALHLYPFFLALTIYVKNESKYVQWLYFVISFIVLFICLTFYTRGYFIS